MTERIHSHALNAYRFFAVNELDAVVSARFIQCTDDADARTIGKSLVTEAYGIEVWDVGRRILKVPGAGKPTA